MKPNLMAKPQGKKICPHFAKGSCKWGKKCKMSHEKQETEKKICKLFLEGRCRFRDQCKFIHEGADPVKNQNNEEEKLLEQQLEKQSSQLQQQQQEQLQQLQQQQKKEEEEQKKNEGKQQQQQQRKQSHHKQSSRKHSKKSSYNEEEHKQQDLQGIKGEVKNEVQQKGWRDFTKSEEARQHTEYNTKELFQGDFIKHVQSLKGQWEKDLAQLQRKFLSTFRWVVRDIEDAKVFQIKYSPFFNRHDFCVNTGMDIQEGYLWFEIVLPDLFPQQPARFLLQNTSVESGLKNSFQDLLLYYHKKQGNSLFKLFKFLDNNLDTFFLQAKDILALRIKEEEKQRAKDKEAYKQQLLKEANESWSQEEQSDLEQAIHEFKNIQDKEEKWQKIAEYVETKNMAQCLARFNFCREQALRKREQRKQSSSSSEEDEDSEEYDSSSGDESEYENDGYQDKENLGEISEGEQDEEEEKQEEQKENNTEQKYPVEFNIVSTMKDLHMTGIALCRIKECRIQAKCSLCKFPSELKVTKFYSKNSDEVMVNDLLCVNCNHAAILLLKRAFAHSYEEPVMARIGTSTWEVLDIININFEINCEQCNNVGSIKSYVSGEKVIGKCFSCHTSYSFQFFGISVQKQMEEHMEKYSKKQQNQQLQQDLNLIKKKKVGVFKVGQALPANGICSHYRHSYRYFRFPCCGKAYPCDICHYNAEGKNHEPEHARAMICGFCGKEQSVRQECQSCKQKLTKIQKKGGHWENGEGVRDKKKMSKGDKQKYSGMSKTVSRKKQQAKNKK